MTIKREDYIKAIAKNLADNRKRIDTLKAKDTSAMTQGARGKHEASLNWEFMAKSMNEERLKFALGCVKLEDLRDYYEPSPFHKYNGVRVEMEKLQFC